MGAADRDEIRSKCPPGESSLRALVIGGLVAVAGTLFGPTVVVAQELGSPPTEEVAFGDALWWSLGAGGGSVRLTCDICAADRDAGLTLHLGLGARAREDLDVGIEVGVWTREDGNVRETAQRVDLRAILRPWTGSGFHVIGGIGWVGYSADELGYDSVALSAGAGWDFPLSGRWRIGNRLLLDAASYGSFSNDQGVAADEVSLSIARLEVVLLRR